MLFKFFILTTTILFSWHSFAVEKPKEDSKTPQVKAQEYNIRTETLNIVTTDSNILYILQDLAQDVAISNKLQVHISLIDDSRVTRSLQLGKKGDALITSDIKLCESLSLKGLASPLDFRKISQESIFCTNSGDDGKVLVLIPEKYPSYTQEKIGEIALILNASIYVLNKNEDAHKKMEEWMKLRMPVCGFASTFLSLNIKESSLKETNAKIEYFACPLIGLKKDGYNILIRHYETHENTHKVTHETQHNS